MGLFDFLKKNPAGRERKYTYAPTMSGVSPFYSAFGDDLYASDIVVQSIRCKANEFKKLDPRHIRTADGQQFTVTDSSVSKILRRPNPLMTTAEFLEKITILFELNKNVFIYPEYYISKGGQKIYTALYPLKPANVWYLVDESGAYFVRLLFASGYEAVLPASDIIHWRKDYGVNDFFGGGMFGGDDSRGLMRLLREYDKLCQSIAKAISCSCQINGVLQYNTYLNNDEMEQKRKEFETRLRNNESGILTADLQMQYTNLPRDIKIVDAETLKYFHDSILRANGTSLAIMSGDYTKVQKEAYYEHALESDIKALGQAMSRVFFSDGEVAHGNEVVLYPNKITFMSMENKISALQTMLPAGTLTKDEARELLGYPPLPNGQGQVISQGYNSLLGEDNQNKLAEDDKEV